jgi:hypothetical protein
MSGTGLSKALAAWVETTLRAPTSNGREHCFQIRPHFRIPGAGRVDLLTLRHDRGTPERIRIDFWNIVPRTVSERDVDAMMRRVHAFQAWYAELIEHAETQGFSAGHQICIRGNLAGKSVCRTPFVDLLSHWGSTIFFWTWSKSRAGLDLVPAYDRPPALKSARTQLKSLLDHLRWDDSGTPDETLINPTRATC